MLAIKNARLILPDREVPDGLILCDAGKLLYAGEAAGIPEGAQVLDAGGLYAGPGFVDVHCHGGGFWSSGNDPDKYARYHLVRGTTSILATLGYGEEPQNRLERARRIREAMPHIPNMLGIHCEGPYKNPKFGFPGKYQTPVTMEYTEALYEACGHIDMMMVSPDAAEPEVVEPVLRFLREHDVVLASGHGDCNREQYALLKKWGLRNATHHYCASGNYVEQHGVRKVGLDELVDLDEDVYAEIIPDHIAAHVAPERIRLCNLCKGVDKVIVITDSVCVIWNEDDEEDEAMKKALPDPRRPHSAEDCDIHWVNNSLDGSELDMAKACYNMRRHSGQSVAAVWRQASENPARMLYKEDRVGRLLPGLDADIVVADADFNVLRVVCKGKLVA